MTVPSDVTQTQLVCIMISTPLLHAMAKATLTISLHDTHIFRFYSLSFTFADGTVVAEEQMRVRIRPPKQVVPDGRHPDDRPFAMTTDGMRALYRPASSIDAANRTHRIPPDIMNMGSHLSNGFQ